MKSADEYAKIAEEPMSPQRMIGYALLSLAAATFEAARLTLDAQASNLLSALEEPEPEPSVYCNKEWVDEGERCPAHWQTRVHRCEFPNDDHIRCCCVCEAETCR